MMPRSFLLTSYVLFSALASACGSLASDTDQHEPLAVLHGELSKPNAISTSNFRVAAIWVCGSIEGDMNLVTQDVAVQSESALLFRLELTEPPPANCMIAQRAVGTIAAYDDLNGNRKLDLVGPKDTEYIDAVVGTNEFLSLVYFEGLAEDDRDSDGNLPSLGYNLQVEVREAYDRTVPAGAVKLCTYDPGDSWAWEEGAIVEPAASEGDEPTLKWTDAGTIFTLTMTSDAQFSTQICPMPGTEAWEVSVYAEGQSPAQYPSAQDSGLTCMAGGAFYFYKKSCVHNRGICGGKTCTGECWYVPDPANPPDGWPCSLDEDT